MAGRDPSADGLGGYPRRIAVLGCGGAGKTYVARALASTYGLPLVQADDIVYRTGTKRPEAHWQAELNARAGEDAWVIDAMKLSILEYRVRRADTVVFCDLPRRSCYLGLVQRRNWRRDLSNPQFLRWIWRFPSRSRPRILELLAGAEADVVVLRSRRAVRRFVRAAAATRSP